VVIYENEVYSRSSVITAAFCKITSKTPLQWVYTYFEKNGTRVPRVTRDEILEYGFYTCKVLRNLQFTSTVIPSYPRSSFFSELTASRPALGPTHPPVQWVQGALSPARECSWPVTSI